MIEDNNNNPIPQLDISPEALEEDRIKKRDEELQQYWLDPRENYPSPYNMLEYNGVPFSTIGGLQAISGQKKNGKTFVMTQIMAAILGRGTNRVKEFLPGLECPQRTVDYLGHEPRVLFIDTEMEKLNTAKVLRRVHWLCEWEMNEPNSRFNVMWMRSVKADEKEPAYKKRYRLIKMAIEATSPDFVVIDGVRDIIGDFNNNEQSSELVTDLMALAEDRQICIWLALHMNPRMRNDDDSKMRGHLGTELGNKVTDTLVSIKKKQGADVTFTVQQQDARDKDIEDWQYIITDAAGNLGIPKILGFSKLQQTIDRNKNEEDMQIYDTIMILKDIMLSPKSVNLSEIWKYLKSNLHVGEPKAQKFFNKIHTQYPALIYERDNRKWTMSKKELEAIEKGLPFAGPEDSAT